MDSFIHRENLALYRRRLVEAKDDATRKVIQQLLTDEEAKDDIPRVSQGGGSAGKPNAS
ncbi:hypothetical protein [Bradyrhizobium sp.]|uniref:hypothetical protein n=1 Tax=Bradyrhizobium sp. TaxID=376 RepID=UPI0025B8ED1B|nr:hypothetical protein [Bradyrhizobium sp.]